MIRAWLYALVVWLFFPVFVLLSPGSVTEAMVAAGLVERSPWAGVGALMISVVAWLVLMALLVALWFVVAAGRGES